MERAQVIEVVNKLRNIDYDPLQGIETQESSSRAFSVLFETLIMTRFRGLRLDVGSRAYYRDFGKTLNMTRVRGLRLIPTMSKSLKSKSRNIDYDPLQGIETFPENLCSQGLHDWKH